VSRIFPGSQGGRYGHEGFRDKLIVEITPQDINKELSGFAQSSRNAKLRIFRAIFNLGIKRGYLTLNPVARLDFAELETKMDWRLLGLMMWQQLSRRGLATLWRLPRRMRRQTEPWKNSE
jgi:hypothetical protein